MSLSARSIAALAALLALSGLLLAFLMGVGGKADAQGVSTPVTNSPNVELIDQNPGTAGISGVFSRTAPYFYSSGLDQFIVWDVSNPRNPERVGTLPNVLFQNEAMTMGERVEGGKIRRFALIGNDMYQVSAGSGGIQRGRIGGGELIVVEVTDPTNPQIIGRTPSTGTGSVNTSTHTVACMNASCSVAYSAGDSGKFSVIDLTDLTKPKQVKELPSPASKPNPVFTVGSGHHWGIDGAGVAFHTGSGGAAAFDISDPMNPQALNGTDANGTKTPYNDFIQHNSQRPNARAFEPGAKPLSVANGNVALIAEEDYANDGDELSCDRAGTFQTWEVPSLDGGAYRAANPRLDANKGSIKPLDTINPPNEGGGGLTTPAGGFCSAHWFDFHQSGVVAQGFYQQGLRLINTRNPRDLKQEGFFTGGGTETWDAYWVPQRNKDGTVRPGYKQNIVYTTDAVRGLDVFEVKNLPPDLPVTGDEGGRGAFPADPTTVGAANQSQTTRCGSPESAISRRSSRITRSRLRLRGTARGRGCSVTKVRVAIGRKVGRQCRFLRGNGRFGSRRSCLRTQYLNAGGRTRWSLNRRVRLPRGSYLIWSRAIDSSGQIERKAKARNLLARRVR